MRARAITLPLLAAAVSVALAPPAPGAQRACPSAYQYAGLVAPQAGAGIGASITELRPPGVSWGHVAAWVGVGGPGAGPNGADEWLQVGLSGFEQGVGSLYYEVTQPGVSPRYVEVLASVRPRDSHDVAVREITRRPGWWRVWVDGTPVSDPISLPGSHGRWRPMAMTESWNGGRRVCNAFHYAFARVRLVARPGGVWRPFAGGSPIENGGYRVLAVRRGAFAATG